MLQEKDDASYMVALDANTGKMLWHRKRQTDAIGESRDSYTTPILLEQDGNPLVVITGGDYVTAHNPATGEEVWRAGGLNPKKSSNYRIVSSPVAYDGLIFGADPGSSSTSHSLRTAKETSRKATSPGSGTKEARPMSPRRSTTRVASTC